ncbi:lasso peptide biosynthesis PqqD family chaperone [Paenibacillus sepulcri]|uniref:Lasso peptide biosynthesis PqqD family chaperone n=1 Tax=Paenibacillus sepulcri TaxID=359917 RepID=A0ABS7BV40_9BACL|nr:lasso peptide biosynthesis PqqD family chaperone [Paenibacillus sepulcri]
MDQSTAILNKRYSQVEGNLASDMDGEKVMMSVKTGKYYNLGQVGGRIWDIIGTPTAGTDIIAILTAEYDIEESECQRQVLAFLEQLRGEDLIRVEEESGAKI